MSWQNYDSVMSQLSAVGLVVDKTLDLDGRIQRWKTEDDPREKRGWSRLREWRSKAGSLYIVGVYGVWQGTDDGKTKIEFERDGANQITAEDREAIRAANKEAARKLAEERKHEAKRAGAWASQVWSKCAPCTGHEYLERKRIHPHSLRVLENTKDLALEGIDDANWWRLTQAVGALVVPMHDAVGNVCGLQFIYGKDHPRREKLDKEFWPSGMAMGGSFGLLGSVRRTGVLLVAEGFATAASLHEATGQSVVYAFSANNLIKAGKELRKTYGGLRLLFCADDDYLTTGNPGCSAAAQATAEIEKSAWTKPDFTDADGNDLRNGKKLTDFNDLAMLTGLPLTLANQINAKLDELKWRDSPTVAGPSTNGGGGSDGVDFKGRRHAQSVMPLDDIVTRFVPIDDGTGKYVFDGWTNKIASREQMISVLPPGMRGDDIKRHPVWKDRGAYYLDEVGFDPSGKDAAVRLNTWQGWPMQPKHGNCEKLLGLLRYLCCDDAVFRWVLCWMAYPLQHPGAKMSSAIIMHGPQGTGKSTVWQCLAKIYGDYATVLNQRGLEDRFNSDWVDSKLLILAEEVVTRAEMWHIKNELKELITGEWIRVNPKNVAAYRQRNQVNCVFLSNENQPLPLDNDDRRHCVIYTPPALSEEEYDAVFIEIERGGIEAFYHHLLDLDLGEFHPKKRPPMTEAKQALIALSSPSETRFMLEWVSGDLGLPICPALSTDVYALYLKWCRLRGESRPRPDNQFFGALARQPGWQKKRLRVYQDLRYTDDTIQRIIVLPPEHLIEQKYVQQQGVGSQATWLTGCIHAFSDAINAHENARMSG